MKYIFAPLVLLLLGSCARDKKESVVTDHSKTDWAFYKLNDNVKTVSEKSVKLINGKPAGTGSEIQSTHDTDIEFDNKGTLIKEKKWLDTTTPFEESFFEGKDKLTVKTQFMSGKPAIVTQGLWDKEGNNTMLARRNPDNSQIDRVSMRYKNGKIEEKVTYNMQDNPIDRITYIYDKKGNLQGENLYLGSETVKVKTLYTYDDKNHRIGEARYNLEKLNYKTSYTYDAKGNILDKITTDAKGTTDYAEHYTYDANGRVLTHNVFEKYDNSTSTDSYTYDKNGTTTQWLIDKQGQPKVTVSYTYDNNINLTSTHVVDSNNKVLDDRAYQYEYDSHKNWTKKTVLLNGKPQFIAERKITYFE